MVIRVSALCAGVNDGVVVRFVIQDGERVQKESFLVGAATVADLGIAVGECDSQLFDSVARAAELYAAINRGIAILGYGACSRKNLIRKLVLKGIDREIAVDAADELERRGLRNTVADAEREAERCVGKLWGRRRIVASMRQRGYEDGEIRKALYALEDAEVDFTELCIQRLRKSCDSIPREPAGRARLVASLERYGFDRSEIRDAINQAFDDTE